VSGIITTLDYDETGPLVVVEDEAGQEIMRMPMDEALGMAYTIIGLSEDAEDPG